MAKDLRYSRTEKNIRKAFIELLKTMPYEKIKINDIVELAEISRNAFYLHYYSKDELLDSFIESFAEKFIKAQDQILGTAETHDLDEAKECTNAIISPFFEDKEISTLLFRIESVSRKLADKLADYFYSRTDKNQLSSKEQLDLKLFSEYRANGIFGMLRYDFQHGLPYTAEELVGLLFSINTGDTLTSITPFAQK